MLISIISFLFVFTFIALVHECGHLIWAKRAGVRVYELALGFGPRIISFKRNDTIYALNLIPILGYVRIAGEGESEEDKSCPESEKLYSKTPMQKLKTLAAGAGMNLLSAFLLLTLVFAITGVPKGLSNEIGAIAKGSPAEKAGLKIGDRLVAINGRPYPKMEEAIDFIHKSQGKTLTLTVERSSQKIIIKATPRYNQNLKVALLGFTPKPLYQKVNPIMAIYHGIEQTILMALTVLIILFRLITGSVSILDLAGPVGIAQITGRYAQTGLVSFLSFTAFISINIGLLNLLPIPALDGGHILFILIEWARKRPIEPKLINKINYWGLIVLLTLMGLITINDLFRLLGNQ